MTRILACLLALHLVLSGAPALAQDGLFSPRILVNGDAITEYEFEQRVLMLTLFRTQGDVEEEARTGLIDDRIRVAAGEVLDVELTPERIMAGMEEFASRANLTAEEFLKALGEAGVAAETFRDFVKSGLVWREVVRARFLGRVEIGEDEVDRAIAAITQSSSVRVLLSEIVIPVTPGNESSARALARRLQFQARGEEAFAEAARQYSSAPTASRGGERGWIKLSDLPADLASLILALGPGQVSPPFELPEGVAIFLLRDVEQGPPVEARSTAIEYATVTLSYARDPVAEAERLRTEADTCNDLNGLVSDRLPVDALRRVTQNAAELPSDIALEVSRLDPGEGAPMIRSGVPLFVMLCSRTPVLETPINRDVVRNNLLNQRLGALADGLLEELRADAIITEPGALPAPANATD